MSDQPREFCLAECVLHTLENRCACGKPGRPVLVGKRTTMLGPCEDCDRKERPPMPTPLLEGKTPPTTRIPDPTYIDFTPEPTND